MVGHADAAPVRNSVHEDHGAGTLTGLSVGIATRMAIIHTPFTTRSTTSLRCGLTPAGLRGNAELLGNSHHEGRFLTALYGALGRGMQTGSEESKQEGSRD